MRNDSSVNVSVDNFLVQLVNSLDYDDANTVLEPVAINLGYSSTQFTACVTDQPCRVRYVPPLSVCVFTCVCRVTVCEHVCRLTVCVRVCVM